MTNALKQYPGFKAGRITSVDSAGEMSFHKKEEGHVPSAVLQVEGDDGPVVVTVPLTDFGRNPIAVGGYYLERDDGKRAYMPAAPFNAIYGSQDAPPD